VSCTRRNADKAKVVLEELHHLRPPLRFFYDQMSLRAGTAWQQEIYDAVESCAAFVALYSPDYLQSKVCLEEFHLAKFCNPEAGLAALLPLYVYSASLPAYVKMLNYIDCREGDDAWWLISLQTGKQLAKIPFEDGTGGVSTAGTKAFTLISTTGPGKFGGTSTTQTLKAVDLKSGKVLWERVVQKFETGPAPP
jgi:hypothetical protein